MVQVIVYRHSCYILLLIFCVNSAFSSSDASDNYENTQLSTLSTSPNLDEDTEKVQTDQTKNLPCHQIDPMKHIYVYKKQKSSITLIWHVPFYSASCKLMYTIKLTTNYGIIIPIIRSTDKNIYTVKYLKPCTTYNITVNTNYQPLGKSTKSFSVATSMGSPGSVNNLRSKYNGKDVILDWDEPLSDYNCVSNYKIKWNEDETKIVPGNTTSYQIKNFNSCGNISVQVVTNNETYNSEHNLVRTDFSPLLKQKIPKIPEVDVKKVDKNILIVWNKLDSNNCITGYKIIYNNTESLLDKNARNWTTTAKNCENITIFGYNNLNEGERTDIISPFFESVPKSVENLTKTYDEENQQVLLNWDPPIYPPVCIRNYKIIYGDEMKIIDAKDTNFTIANYTHCNNITVSAINEGGKEGESNHLASPVFEKRPSKVLNLATNYNEHKQELVVSWNPPKNSVKCATEYLVMWGNDKNFTTKDTSYNISNFNSCNNITVVAKHSEGNKKGKPSIQESPLLKKLPSSVKNLAASYDDVHQKNNNSHFSEPGTVMDLKINYNDENQDLMVSWSPPEHSVKCATKYLVMWDNDKSFNTTDTSYKISNFNSCKNVTVVTKNFKDEEGGRSTEESPLFKKRPKMVTNLKKHFDRNSGLLNLTWDTASCDKGYNITLNNKTFHTKNTYFKIDHFSSCHNISVQAVNDYSQPSKPTHVKSPLADKPKLPKLDVNNYNKNITISWNRPNAIDCVSGYKFIYNNKESLLNANEGYWTATAENCKNITIFAYNDLDEVERREIISPFYKIVPSSVENLTATYDKVNQMVHLIWDPPINPPVCIVSYKIEYGDEMQNETQDTSFTIENYTYCNNITVIAINENGDEGDATSIQSPVLDLVPGNVIDLSIIYDDANDNVAVSWEPPQYSVECATKYSIIWDEDQNYNTSSTSYNITNFKSCKNISVIASNLGDEEGERSTEESPLFNEHPKKVANLTGKFDSNTRILSLSWEPVSCDTGYEIKFNQENYTTEDTHLQIPNFKSCHRIGVQAVNNHPEPSDPEYVESPLTDTPEPINVKEEINKTSINFTWDINQTIFDCFENAKVECNAAENEDLPWIVKNKTKIVVIEKGQENITVELKELSEFTNYTCKLYNYGHNNSPSNAIDKRVQTLEEAPEKPKNVTISDVMPYSFEIQWEKPEKIPGVLESYVIQIERLDNRSHLPAVCKKYETITWIKTPPNIINYKFDNATPYTRYKIQVMAQTYTYNGTYSDEKEEITKEEISSKPNDFYGNIIYEMNPTSASVILMWSLPCEINGPNKYFNLGRKSVSLHENDITDEQYVNITLDVNKTEYKYTWENLMYTDRKYDFVVHAANSKFPEGHRSKLSNQGADVPPNNVNHISPPSEYTDSPYFKALFQFDKNIFNSSNGEIKYYAIILAEEGQYNVESDYGFWNEIDDTTWPVYGNWSNQHPIKPYLVKEVKWNPFNATTNSIHIILGGDFECQNFQFCNMPLQQNTSYQLILRAFTKNAYRDSKPTKFRTRATPIAEPPSIGAVLGSILGIIFAGICAVISLYLWRQYKVRRNEKDDNAIEMGIRKFSTKYKLLKKDNAILQNEFEELQKAAQELNISTTTASLVENKKKNRYVNILPYDSTRVTLSTEKDDESDYINASYIRGYSGNIEYIACQGPLQSTQEDFWKMVIQESVTVIVMVTQFEENGKDKCYKYFPSKDQLKTIGDDIEVHCNIELDFGFFICRNLRIIQGLHSRAVTHLQYIEWPDFGCPSEPSLILQYINYMKEKVQANPGKIVIHCSAGVGRTGTLIAVDILLQHLKTDKNLHIYDTVLELRRQRTNMVQTERQYGFIYDCVFTAIQNPEEKKVYEKTDEPLYANLLEAKAFIINENKESAM